MERAPRRAGLLVVCATVLVLGAFRLYNNDIGYHVAYGRRILETRSVPVENVFSSVHRGHPIHDDKWLFQVAVALVDRAGGPLGLVLLRIALVALLAALVLALHFEELPAAHPLPWLGTTLVLWAMSERFLLRPELVSYVLLAASLWVVERARHDRGGWWPLVPLQIVWVNVHGYFILGPCIVGAALVADLPRKRAARWAAPLAAVAAACFASPAGWRAAAYPFVTLWALFQLRGRRAHILEFQPSLEAELFPTHTYYLYVLLLAAAPLAVLAAWRRRAGLYRPILLAAHIAMSLTIRRNVVLLGLVGGWLLAASLGRLAPPARAGRRLRGLAWVLLLLSPLFLLQAATDRLYLVERRNRRTGLGLSRVAYPEGAARFLLAEPELRGVVYWNNFDIGSYLLWRLPPDRLPLIDSNMDSYPLEFKQRYLALMQRRESVAAYARRYGIDCWVVHHGPSDTLDLVGRLARDRGWALVYLDPLTVVYLRRAPRFAATIERLELDLAARERDAPEVALGPPRPRPGFFLRRLLSPRRVEYPSHEVYLGKLYATLDCPRLARVHYAVALQAAPWDPRLFNQAGLLLASTGDQALARQYLAAAIELKRDYAPAHHNLARLTQGDAALVHHEAAFGADPRRPDYALALAAAYLERKRPDEALRVLRRGLAAHEPSHAVHRALGELLEARSPAEAVTHYRRSLELRENQPELLLRIERLKR